LSEDTCGEKGNESGSELETHGDSYSGGSDLIVCGVGGDRSTFSDSESGEEDKCYSSIDIVHVPGMGNESFTAVSSER
jgi:hypothetical protein